MSSTVFERRPATDAAIEHALGGARQSVFWLEDVTAARYGALRGRVDTDLVVVGGGYHGLWTAIRAKERDPGRRVVLLEAHRIGWAASGRNGGFTEASLTHGAENGHRRWPDEMVQLDRIGDENLRDLVATIDRHGLDVDLDRSGVMSVAVEEHQVDWLREAPSTPHDRFLDGDEVRAQVHSPIYLAGRWKLDECVMVHPAKLAGELARLAGGLGVELYERSRVVVLESDATGVTVRTDAGEVRASHAALATNVFPSLLKRNRLMTVPVYDYVLATEPLSAAQLSEIGWTERQGLTDLANQFHYYRRTHDDRIVFGGYDAVYHSGGRVRPEYEDRPASFRTLASHFLTTFPQLEGMRFTNRWAGAIDTCSRFCAFYGTARRRRVAYAAGFTGLGVAATRFAGDVLLDLLDGRPTERTALRMVRETPMPFPPEPAASIGINATRWALDRADHHEGRRNALLRTLDALGLGFDS